MRRILILGGGTQQLSIIRAARDQMLYTVVFDKNPLALGRREAHKFQIVDIYNEEESLQAALEMHEVNPFSGVLTMGTDCSLTVARIAKELKLPGIPYATAEILRDKLAFRTFCREHNLPIPEFCAISTDNSGLIAAQEFFKSGNFDACVLKPTRSMGSRGVITVRSEKDIELFFEKTLPYTTKDTMLIEAHVGLPEYSVDAFVIDSRVNISGVAERTISIDPYNIELGHSLPADIDSFGVEGMSKLFQKIAELLQITSGTLKGDIFYKDDSIILGEMAARLSGGFMSGWTIPYAKGTNPATVAVLAAISALPSQKSLVPSRSLYASEISIISMPGTTKRLEGSKLCIEYDWCKHIFLHREIGSRVSYPSNNTDKIASIVFTASTKRLLIERRKYLLAHFCAFLSPNDSETNSFLFSKYVEALYPDLGCPLPSFISEILGSFVFPDDISPWNAQKMVLNLGNIVHDKYRAFLSDIGEEHILLGPYNTTREEEDSAQFFMVLHQAEKNGVLNVGKSIPDNRDILLYHVARRGGYQGLRYICDSVAADKKGTITNSCYELYLQRFS